MAQLIIDNLDDRPLEILRLKASLHGPTVEEARHILSGGTKLTNAERLAAAREIAAMTPLPQKTDSLDLLREDRNG